MSCSCRCSCSPVASPVARAEVKAVKVARRVLRAPIPPKALRGIEGMKEADSILKGYGVAGLLIGGLAKAILSGVTDPDELRKHKDVDVLISYQIECAKHPRQWEGGIDWWVSHSESERPTNGKAHLLANIGYCVSPRSGPGLYICSPGALYKLCCLEERVLGGKFEVKYGPNKRPYENFDAPDLGFEYQENTDFYLNWDGEPIAKQLASHCKPV